MADDVTGAVTGMIPTVLAIGILKRTTDTMLPSRNRNPVGRKIGKKLSVKELTAYAKEESEAAREYLRLGFKTFSRDEAKHARFFKRELKKAKR